EAVASFHKALDIEPDYADAHHNFSLTLLLQGDFPNGFEQYEWRRRTKMCPRRVFAQPEWDGGPFPGRTLLLHAEQGLGDTLHFIRYAPLVRDLGGRVVIECQKPLADLLGSVAGIDAIVPEGNPLPPFDLHTPLLSLPHLLGTTEATVPTAVPYLSPEPGAVEVWRHRVGRGEELKVGLVWAGSPGHKNDRNRSISLERLRPLLDVPGIRFFALQVGERASDIEAVGLQGLIDDISPDLNDFADTAAALSVLDLLISVDTAPAHLAGALGRPVWLLLPFVPDWRWMMDREDSPWYPTMRLFRQPMRSDWLSVIHRIGNELAALV
ncbi:MAG: hypothetical protein IIC53_03595, partial [Proteobacteria bacterium]|nr:hypothetical protein [Pseudomonadota bacterium]